MQPTQPPTIAFGHFAELIVRHAITDVELAWPPEAVFCVTYRTRCWPDTRYGEDRKVYFENEDQLDAWLENQRDWADLEDNKIAGYVEEWDLGPVFRRSFDYW